MSDKQPVEAGNQLVDLESHRLRGTAFLAGLSLLAYYALALGVAPRLAGKAASQWHQYLPFLERLSLSLLAIFAILLLGKLTERLIVRSQRAYGVRYNLVRLVRLAVHALVIIVGISFLFQNLYAAALSFGLISLVLGFALQAPITSFIGWVYIVFRHPYQVGDRIQFGTLRGDVVEIGYLDTRIRECSGVYLGNDRPSGRIIHLPNSIILKSEVINYSGPGRPFIWNETAIQVAYTSDLPFVEDCLKRAADEDFLQRHPDQAAGQGGQHGAEVYFRVNERAWLEAVVSYPVEPTDTTGRRNRILHRALPALNREPGKVQFPQGSLR